MNPIKLSKAVFATVAAVALVKQAKGQTINFVNLDGVDRAVVFTPNTHLSAVATLQVPAYGQVKQTFPAGWGGNAYAVPQGAPNVPSNLAEVQFGGYNGQTSFDISTIVNTGGTKDGGINLLQPQSGAPVSGCPTYDTPCSNAYNVANDPQTKTTMETDLVAFMGVATTGAP